MNIYFAPMEGIIGYIYRNEYEKIYGRGRIDKYFMPFIAPSENKGFTQRQINDIIPEHNSLFNPFCQESGAMLVPQILTNNPKHFLKTVEMLYGYGYKEINLNLGCPSGTVVSKFKGSGFLAQPDKLDEFFDEVFSSGKVADKKVKISVKTRIGVEKPEEFYELIEIFNRYPFEEVIIHPRVRLDYYKNTPHMEIFDEALKLSKNPVCYNGDIFTAADYEGFVKKYSEVDRIMLGRGFIAQPWLIDEIRQDEPGKEVKKLLQEKEEKKERERLKKFHDAVYKEYLNIMSGDKNAIHKMKELWTYMRTSFEGCDKEFKNIKKAQKMDAYETAVNMLFLNAKLIEPEKKCF